MPHIWGTAYTLLFNIAVARHGGGEVVLRIEDTDQTRSRPEYEEPLISSLHWLGLTWDEGPDVGGPCGPYRQSERLEIYQQHAHQLVEAGHAYYSFTSAEELAAWRGRRAECETPPFYADRQCDPHEARRRVDGGESFVVRMKTPEEGTCTVVDTLRDEIAFAYAGIDDQIILKSDGFPTYHLAVVVDDHLMGIDWVIRGEEWISSTPKHLLLYEHLGWQPPTYTHLPLLLNPDRSKMSKRRNPTSIDYYRRAGFLPGAVVNYLALMAYPPEEDGEEKFDVDRLIERFDPARINLGGSIFDPKKLSWLNGRYIREDLSPVELHAELKSWLLNDEFVARIVPLMHERMETLGDFMPRTAFLFACDVAPSEDDLVPAKRETTEVAQMMQTVVWALEDVQIWNRDEVEGAIRRASEFWEWPIRDVTRPLFVALMGQAVGPPLYDSIVLLDLDMTRTRLLTAVSTLGGVSKKRLKALERRWR